MVRVIKISPTGFACNSYLLTADGKNAVAIDAGQSKVLKVAEKEGLTVTHVLLTHGHFDHIGGCSALQKRGALVGCHKEETDVLEHYNLAEEFGVPLAPVRADFTFGEGEWEANGVKIRVIATPGHTKGSASFLVENYLFSGDTLFHGSVGRTDFPTGNGEDIVRSVKKLYALSGDYAVFAGHDEDTTLDRERKYNMCVRGN